MDFAGVAAPPDALFVDMDFVPPPDPVDSITGGSVYLRLGGSNAVCFRSITVTHGGQPLDITDSCSNGHRELAFDPAFKMLDLSIEAITKSSEFRALKLGGSLYIEDAQLVYPPMDGNYFGDVIIANFMLSEYAETASVDGVVTFSATLQSVGPWYYFPEVSSATGFILDNPDLADVLADIYG
jgi:hypothetical protein